MAARSVRELAVPLLGLLAVHVVSGCAREPGGSRVPAGPATSPAARTLRLAQFNVQELSEAKIAARDPQLLAAAEIVRRVSPDVVVLQEVDLPPEEPLDQIARAFVRTFLAPLDAALDYPHVFVAPTNTGVISGRDLNRDGIVATEAHRGSREYGEDCYGFGLYPGQYSMAVLSRVPIDTAGARTFQRFLWRDLPDNHLPLDFYGPENASILRLSSKSHWDLPLLVDGPAGSRKLHLLVSHPTPPVFDGEEDRNGRRNFDEIRFWSLYLDGDAEPAVYDDQGRRGGLAPEESFVLAGDLNARPDPDQPLIDGRTAISQLLLHPRVQDPALSSRCRSRGAPAGGATGDPSREGAATAEFLGGARVDYLLPSRDLEVAGCEVYWPSDQEDPEAAGLARAASDHRLIWLDLRLGSK